MKKLERQLNTPLWIKEGRRLRLTQAGSYLLNLADRLLPQLIHAEEVIRQLAEGKRGVLRIGMECHPCYRWLLRIVSPFLEKWPDVDVDVKREIQFTGIAALVGYDIDLLITPDPLFNETLYFVPVFDYELVLVVPERHPLAEHDYVVPEQLLNEDLITYPVEIDRLDVFTQFLLPAHCHPKRHKTLETVDIMLQMVGSNRGVSALPRWIVTESENELPLRMVRLGPEGIQKQIFVGIRKADSDVEYLQSFIELARISPPDDNPVSPWAACS
jgi:LysR family transcriptional regulator for metE and metH